MTWKEIARKLRFGEKRKVAHCKNEPTAYISNGVKGVSLYCFRCRETEFEWHGQRSIQDIMRTKRAEEKITDVRMPDDCVSITESPMQSMMWLLKAGITPEEADAYGFRWHEEIQRVLFPVMDGERIVGICGRAVFGETPKYRMYSGRGVYFIPGNRVVIVEDVLSCLRIAREGYGSVALMGTSMRPEDAPRIAKAEEVIVWTDGDAAGDRAWKRIRRQLSLYPVEVRRVRTDVDPKGLHRAEIRRRLS